MSKMSSSRRAKGQDRVDTPQKGIVVNFHVYIRAEAYRANVPKRSRRRFEGTYTTDRYSLAMGIPITDLVHHAIACLDSLKYLPFRTVDRNSDETRHCLDDRGVHSPDNNGGICRKETSLGPARPALSPYVNVKMNA